MITNTTEQESRLAAPPLAANLPAVIPPPPPPRRRRPLRIALALVVLLALGTGTAWWWFGRPAPLPPGIAFSNGRLEADEIDIATKFPGRIAQVLVDEGDIVHAGQVLAVMDTRDMQASLHQAEAQITAAQSTIAVNRANLAQQGSMLKYAAQELQRARELVPHGFETQGVLDQRQSQFDAAMATYRATEANIAAATAAMEAAEHAAALIRVNIADNTFLAPVDGRIQYKLANAGEVLGTGGKVFTMIDTSYLYMDIFLPTAEASRVSMGADARIVLDARPKEPIPAHVSMVAAQNQFTPKMVETRSERDKLMFRVRVKVDPAWLRPRAAAFHSGIPGLAYVKLDTGTTWPAALQGAL